MKRYIWLTALAAIMYLLFQNLKSAAAAAMDADSQQQQPEVVNVTFSKVNNSLGLSIVAAKVQCFVFFVRLPSCTVVAVFSFLFIFCFYVVGRLSWLSVNCVM